MAAPLAVPRAQWDAWAWAEGAVREIGAPHRVERWETRLERREDAVLLAVEPLVLRRVRDCHAVVAISQVGFVAHAHLRHALGEVRVLIALDSPPTRAVYDAARALSAPQRTATQLLVTWARRAGAFDALPSILDWYAAAPPRLVARGARGSARDRARAVRIGRGGDAGYAQ